MCQKTENGEKGFGSPLNIDTLFSILSRERRRYALYCLQQYQNPMALADLADEVARFEHDEQRVAEIPAEDVKSVYMTLYHTHLPKMEDAGIIEYDQNTDSVQLRDEFSGIQFKKFI